MAKVGTKPSGPYSQPNASLRLLLFVSCIRPWRVEKRYLTGDSAAQTCCISLPHSPLIFFYGTWLKGVSFFLHSWLCSQHSISLTFASILWPSLELQLHRSDLDFKPTFFFQVEFNLPSLIDNLSEGISTPYWPKANATYFIQQCFGFWNSHLHSKKAKGLD